jgi:hypothetical protein
MILSRHARPGIDLNTLIEKKHKDANLRVFQASDLGHPHAHNRTTTSRLTSAKTGNRVRNSQQLSLTDENLDFLKTAGDSAVGSQDSAVRPATRKRVKAKSTSASFEVGLHLFHSTSPEGFPTTGPFPSYGIVFIDDDTCSAAHCFTHIDQHIKTGCAYIEFHPPEDMTLESRIRIDTDTEEAEETFERVVTMLREAQKFPDELSYRAPEVEIVTDRITGNRAVGMCRGACRAQRSVVA